MYSQKKQKQKTKVVWEVKENIRKFQKCIFSKKESWWIYDPRISNEECNNQKAQDGVSGSERMDAPLDLQLECALCQLRHDRPRCCRIWTMTACETGRTKIERFKVGDFWSKLIRPKRAYIFRSTKPNKTMKVVCTNLCNNDARLTQNPKTNKWQTYSVKIKGMMKWRPAV